MEFFLDDLVGWIYTLAPGSVYAIFFLIAYLEYLVPPMPGDMLVVFGGYLAAQGVIEFETLLVLTTVSSVMGFMTMYGVGSYWGYRIDQGGESFWLAKWFDKEYFDRGKRWVMRWGQWVIIANRFLAGTRSVISLIAGIYRTKIKTTILSSAVSSLIWNFVLLSAGWFVHENWQEIGRWLHIYGWIIAGLLLLFGIYWYLKERLSKERPVGE